ncbi:MAG: hypothetical protein KDA41_10120 [Planctomycetales bacterium]|nr:hypothetical protein [Planctomycetales bacterium]
MLVRGAPVDAPPLLAELADRMKACRSGVVFCGEEIAHGPAPHALVEALSRLAMELNEQARFYLRALRSAAGSAANVLCWQTGYPQSVSFAAGWPRCSPGEWTAERMLARGEVDALLIVAGDPSNAWSDAARSALAKTPAIAVGPTATQLWNEFSAGSAIGATGILPVRGAGTGETPVAPVHVALATSIDGVHTPSAACRLDDVPVAQRPFLRSDLPSAADVLDAIRRSAIRK